MSDYNNEMTEADAIGWDYGGSDDDEDTEFSRFLNYHDIDDIEYQDLSGNERRNMWWNFRKFGNGK